MKPGPAGQEIPSEGALCVLTAFLPMAAGGSSPLFTATIASFFMIEDEEEEFRGLHKRLDKIDQTGSTWLQRRIGNGASSADNSHAGTLYVTVGRRSRDIRRPHPLRDS